MKALLRTSLLFALLSASVYVSGCSSDVQGTYSDANGLYILDLKSGGDALVTFMSTSIPGAWEKDGDKIIVHLTGANGEKGSNSYLIHEDGSLTQQGEPLETFAGALRKKN
jgi:hypothetical protein